MHTIRFARANATAPRPPSVWLSAQIDDSSDLSVLAQHMYDLMLRNICSDGFVVEDPVRPGVSSQPGCVIAAPSYADNTPGVDQDYIYHWTRDGAITAMELAAADTPVQPGGGVQELIDYVVFSQTCQSNGSAAGHFARGSFLINGQLRDWSDQNDGPALQTLAILAAYPKLDAATQAIAKSVIGTNINFLLGVYQDQTTNLWEEHQAFSFFARSAQLKCFQAIQAAPFGIVPPAGVAAAVTWLTAQLALHWNGTTYISMLPQIPGYDTNIDIVCAAVYGAVSYTDTKLLASAAQLRTQFADPASPDKYPINITDSAQGLGPLMGRYPGDMYDGDQGDQSLGDHPWALCTANFAQLYYSLANLIAAGNAVPLDALSTTFFAQIGVNATTPSANVITALNNAGDAMMRAIIYHSDHLELSEQFDGVTGYEKSVRNLTWSYASFLSAVRERTGKKVSG
jgi:glucoamylase